MEMINGAEVEVDSVTAHNCEVTLAPTSLPSISPTAFPTSGYVVLVDLTIAATSTKTCSANLPLKNIRWAQHYAAVAAGATNLWPAVLQKLNDVTQSDCIAACEANAACAGWTFKFGLETDTSDNANTCWLADEAGVSDGAATSANSNSGICDVIEDSNQCGDANATAIEDSMTDSIDILDEGDVLCMGQEVHDLYELHPVRRLTADDDVTATDSEETCGSSAPRIRSNITREPPTYIKYSFKVFSTRPQLIRLYEALEAWFEAMGCCEYDSDEADKAGFCVQNYEMGGPIIPDGDPALPTTSPTAYPTSAPTPHPCDDGSHGCEDEEKGGVCYRSDGVTNSWTCACIAGYICTENCDAPYSNHHCTITDAPTATPTPSPTPCSLHHLTDNFPITCEIPDGMGATKWSDDMTICSSPDTKVDGSCGFKCDCDETIDHDHCYYKGTNFGIGNHSACWLPRPPALTVIGDGIMRMDGTHDETQQFVDPGATCVDDLLHCAAPEDCSLAVVTSGDQVDLTVIGTYWIHYHCASPAGFNVTLPREVRVEDNTCPTCSFAVNDSSTITIEASFPYDATTHRATCSDNCGFNSDPKCQVVSTPAAIVSDDVDVEKIGIYHVTFNAVDHHGNQCHNSRAIRTVVVADTMKPIIGLAFNADTLITPHSGGASSATYNPPSYNPARDNFGALMAISGSSSSWLFAGAAAIVGVALFAARSTKGPTAPASVDTQL